MITFNLASKNEIIHPTSTAPKGTVEGCFMFVFSIIYCDDVHVCASCAHTLARAGVYSHMHNLINRNIKRCSHIPCTCAYKHASPNIFVHR